MNGVNWRKKKYPYKYSQIGFYNNVKIIAIKNNLFRKVLKYSHIHIQK